MTPQQAQTILDKIVGQIFGYKNPFTLEQFMARHAFDVRLPAEVTDSTTGEKTWASSTNPTKFMTLANTRKRAEVDDFMLPARPLNSMEDILAAWGETNYTSTDRYIESINVGESDCIYHCENVYRSQDSTRCKNILFSDSVLNCEFVAAGQRTQTSNYSVRVDDSQNCSNSFSVSWSNKVTNGFFINDCFDVMDCMFCSHISGKRFCVANVQVSEEEYKKLKDMVVRWILTN